MFPTLPCHSTAQNNYQQTQGHQQEQFYSYQLPFPQGEYHSQLQFNGGVLLPYLQTQYQSQAQLNNGHLPYQQLQYPLKQQQHQQQKQQFCSNHLPYMPQTSFNSHSQLSNEQQVSAVKMIYLLSWITIYVNT